jgi:organic hydroperoxide reductase OsmC/OhrA
MSKTHHYELELTWTGNTGEGTAGYRKYSRDHDVAGLEGTAKPPIPGSSDPSFRGDAGRWNPEELLVASVAQCHMLWYLSLCARDRIIVTAYADRPDGTMLETPIGGGAFSEVVLRPKVTVASADMLDKATALHAEAHRMCFIANSVNFPVRHEPEIQVAGD